MSRNHELVNVEDSLAETATQVVADENLAARLPQLVWRFLLHISFRTLFSGVASKITSGKPNCARGIYAKGGKNSCRLCPSHLISLSTT